jgi:hypothetical protein
VHDVVEVRLVSGYRVWVRFDDGVRGEVDLSELVVFDGIFEPLRDPERFREVAVHPEFGVLTWPNGADIDSEVLYSWVTGEPIVIDGEVVYEPPVPSRS